jgi:hypothetical protein
MKETDHYEALEVDGRITSKLISKKLDMRL